ncbi:anhydro-N-acetylmuramic acid kinase [Roseomonas sp. OT10]|uniref:anhydro-N-acetylmuramic acid kinase n=1 Tax=Roseomonas cutis TaxID=2897332 RepID=UPI001E4F3F08|nr:anhydro-N-acetylmuramic acid kinase [Roseomonas sp. OT10]UFN50166.1 anhydro-N-acetylmuramic acid kinase [Roseomonas sp. OT10]
MAERVGAIGVMSGTSMDGIDVAFLRTDGEAWVEPGPARGYAYPAATRAALLDLLADPERARHDPLPELEAAVTDAHAAAVEDFLRDAGLDRGAVALVGLHGQTVLHRPEERFTRQLVLGDRAARRLGIPVVDRFRHADVAAGGQGAPFAPLYHRALTAGMPGERDGPLMVLNLGGVGNVTWIDGDSLIAFDTGPANALLDDFVRQRRGQSFDADGALAAAGTADAAVVRDVLRQPFFRRMPPKSLDRNAFHGLVAAVAPLSDADGAATLAALTVEAVAAALEHVPVPPRRWLVTGGGRHNRFFMARFRERLGVPVDPVEAVGWDGDALEAQCFAYLAVRAARGLPLSLPATTGVPHPMPGGRLHPAG